MKFQLSLCFLWWARNRQNPKSTQFNFLLSLSISVGCHFFSFVCSILDCCFTFCSKINGFFLFILYPFVCLSSLSSSLTSFYLCVFSSFFILHFFVFCVRFVYNLFLSTFFFSSILYLKSK